VPVASSEHPGKRLLKDVLYMVAGIALMGMGIKGFLLPSHFIDGGVTGISMLMAESFDLPLPWLIPAINIPFVSLGYQQLGPVFACKSALTITGLAVALAVVAFPGVSADKLLSAVFGGMLIGTGIGLAIRGGAVLDGTEISAILISKATTLKVGDVIMGFNIIIFGTALFVLGVEPALYSILTYLAASKAVNFLTHGLEEHTAVIIVSPHHEALQDHLADRVGCPLWEFYTRDRHDRAQPLLYAVITRREVGVMKKAIQELDPHAWVIIHPLSEALMRVPVKKPVL
jgi:uncharacterized membrane-anchored protein YitT (DUF2179 family)